MEVINKDEEYSNDFSFFVLGDLSLPACMQLICKMTKKYKSYKPHLWQIQVDAEGEKKEDNGNKSENSGDLHLAR